MIATGFIPGALLLVGVVAWFLIAFVHKTTSVRIASITFAAFAGMDIAMFVYARTSNCAYLVVGFICFGIFWSRFFHYLASRVNAH
jgi:hypothetical protein